MMTPIVEEVESDAKCFDGDNIELSRWILEVACVFIYSDIHVYIYVNI